MAIEHFTTTEFERALPKDLWRSIGVFGGEYCYLMDVKKGVAIMIRSSIPEWGVSADVGENSIRAFLVSADDIERPLANKLIKWTTRLPGWQDRLTKILRILWKIGIELGACGKCGFELVAHPAKNGENKGRWFKKCDHCGEFNWLSKPLTKSKQ